MSKRAPSTAAVIWLLATAIFWSSAEPSPLNGHQLRVTAAGYYSMATTYLEMMVQPSGRLPGRTNPIPGALLVLMVGGTAFVVYGAIRGILEIAALVIRRIKNTILRDDTAQNASFLAGMTPEERSSFMIRWQIKQDAAAEAARESRDAISRIGTVILLIIWVYRSC